MKAIVVIAMIGATSAFVPSTTFHLKSVVAQNRKKLLFHEHTDRNYSTKSTTRLSSQNNTDEQKSSIDVMMGKVDIPEEYREEIFRAEANTPAARDRSTRIAIFGIIALLGIGISSFNAFLSNMRDGADLTPINELGFGWVSGNPLTSFLFLNKFGGGLALLSAGLGGTMVELEQRTKNENAEKIWAELQRRKSQAEGGKKAKKGKKKGNAPSSNKKMSKKQRKRLDALSEIINDEDKSKSEEGESNLQNSRKEVEKQSVESKAKEEGDGGIFGKVKDFYEKADSMAQSQALMLNKELEDRGVVEKITDETGLKVIGKEAAAKLQSKDDN